MKFLFINLLLFSLSSLANDKASSLSSGAVNFQKANVKLILPGVITIKDLKNKKNIVSNGIPNHLIGKFPHPENPYTLVSQTYDFYVSLNPKVSKEITELETNMNFGVALNGIPFNPNTNRWYNGDSESGWRYEALRGAVKTGLDENSGHLNKDGSYHYHGLPKLLLKKLKVLKGKISPIIGYAADGFAIRALYGLDGKPVKSSYIVKKGSRPIGGNYDGTFVGDYEFVQGHGDLDECNGKKINGTYTYFITSSFPVVPRCFRGKPDKSFRR